MSSVSHASASSRNRASSSVRNAFHPRRISSDETRKPRSIKKFKVVWEAGPRSSSAPRPRPFPGSGTRGGPARPSGSALAAALRPLAGGELVVGLRLRPDPLLVVGPCAPVARRGAAIFGQLGAGAGGEGGNPRAGERGL